MEGEAGSNGGKVLSEEAGEAAHRLRGVQLGLADPLGQQESASVSEELGKGAGEVTGSGDVQAGDPHVEQAAFEFGWKAVLRSRIAALPALSEPRRQEAARSVRTVLAALRRAEGSCWQERWHNGGWNQAPDLAPLFGDSVRASAFKSGEIMHGLGVLLCLDIVRPSYDWLGRFRFTAGFERLRQVRGAEFFATVRDACQVRKVTRVQEQHAVRMLTIPLAHTGKSPRDLTSQDMLDMCRVLSSRRGQRPPGLTLAWDLLRQLGVLPAGTPTLHDAQRRQRPNIPDMVDFYGLSCPDVRNLIIRYVSERAPAIDYITTRQLIWKLAKRFWKDLEEHHPGTTS
ncbi:hypothetical protein ADK53_34845 [Streptomyces sp. WM6373]|nr:hypothetical protein ADK53_34845 [Streptomyces sp. WM6373]